jgi:hypothetical protein
LISENESLPQSIDALLNSNHEDRELSLNFFQLKIPLMGRIDIEKSDFISERYLGADDTKWMEQ